MKEFLQQCGAWFHRHKKPALACVAVMLVLAAAFWYGGTAPGMQGWRVSSSGTAQAETNTGPSDKSAAERQAAREAFDQRGKPKQDTSDAGSALKAAPEENDAPNKTETKPTDQTEPQSRPEKADGSAMTAEEKAEAAAALTGGDASAPTPGDTQYSEEHGMEINPETGKDPYQTAPVPEGKPLPVEPQTVAVSAVAHTCTLSISCAAILDHMDWLDAEKAELVPSDGWILQSTAVTFYEGESAFNVLQRTCKQQGIHMEFTNTPIYNSAYIEGLNNLYEFDCGELSGWMYQVNDWFPNYGCSRYQLQDGDVVNWVYTCDLGSDVGGGQVAGGE